MAAAHVHLLRPSPSAAGVWACARCSASNLRLSLGHTDGAAEEPRCGQVKVVCESLNTEDSSQATGI